MFLLVFAKTLIENKVELESFYLTCLEIFQYKKDYQMQNIKKYEKRAGFLQRIKKRLESYSLRTFILKVLLGFCLAFCLLSALIIFIRRGWTFSEVFGSIGLITIFWNYQSVRDYSK